MQSFTTTRLFIRPLSALDQTLYCDLYTSDKIMRYIGEPLSINDAKISFERCLKLMQMKKPYFLTWTVVNKNTEQSIGLLTLIISKPKSTSPQNALSMVQPPEIGIVLSQKAQGKLIPEEAMGALMEYGFKQLNLPFINARFKRKNLATKRFVKKLRFELYNDDSDTFCQFKRQNWQQTIITKIL